MESRTINTTRNIIFGVVNKIISIIFPFITRTILIKKLGAEYLGLNSLFTSILQVLNLSELGFGSALIYSMYKPIANGDNQKVCNYLNFYRKCYKVIGILICAIGLILLPFLPLFISGDIPNINLSFIYLIYLANTVISYLFFAYRQSLLIALQRNDLVSKLNSIIIIAQNLLQILLLLLFKNYYYYVIILPIMTLINNILILFVTKKFFPQYNASGKIEKKELKEVKRNVFGMFFQKIGSIVLSSVDNIVISTFLGISILGIYNNYYYIITSLAMFLSVILESLKPSVGNSIVKETAEKNYSDFKNFNFIYNWIVSWFTICFLCLVQNFISLWIGEEYLLSNSLIIVFSIYLFVRHWCDMLYVYQESKGLWWNNRYIQIIGSIVNLILNLLFVKFIGLYGILLSTIISVVFIIDIGYCKILFKEYFNNSKQKKEFIFNQIKYFLVTVVASIFTYMLCSYLGSSISMFIVKIVISCIVPNLILLLFYSNSNEYRKAKQFIFTHYIKTNKNK